MRIRGWIAYDYTRKGAKLAGFEAEARNFGRREEAEAVLTKPTITECPECGADLAGEDCRAHADAHWPPVITDAYMSKEARERRDALYAEQKRRSR